mmetsp:Transcript_42365/g.70198  ORF Transcript_42365/g.70198 Transcript_42365/m.70198 type:complete len:162 (-) Transcript_42365:10-495(-)
MLKSLAYTLVRGQAHDHLLVFLLLLPLHHQAHSRTLRFLQPFRHRRLLKVPQLWALVIHLILSSLGAARQAQIQVNSRGAVTIPSAAQVAVAAEVLQKRVLVPRTAPVTAFSVMQATHDAIPEGVMPAKHQKVNKQVAGPQPSRVRGALFAALRHDATQFC